jgi:hypothetical protein
MLSFLCLKGAKTKGGEENNNHRSLLFSVFHNSDGGQGKNTKMTALCHQFHV